MNNMIKITKKDERWLKNGVITDLIYEYHLKRSKAKSFFEKSPLLALLHEEPDEILHHDTLYWAKFLMERHYHRLMERK